jgi:hypothetical protein
MASRAAAPNVRFGLNLPVPEAGKGCKRRILVVAGCPGEGPFAIQFADLRHGVLRAASSALEK